MQTLSKILIVGGGTSGWLAAAMLTHFLRRDVCQVELVESEELGTIGVGESTVPPLVVMLQRLGIDEHEFMRATDATYKLGIQFVDWHQRSQKYFHPFGVLGRPIGSHEFYQCWLKAGYREQGDPSCLQDYLCPPVSWPSTAASFRRRSCDILRSEARITPTTSMPPSWRAS